MQSIQSSSTQISDLPAQNGAEHNSDGLSPELVCDAPGVLATLTSDVKGPDVIRLLIVDDHPAFRMGLAALVESEPDMKVIAEAGDGETAVEQFGKVHPDVVLMDLRLPGLSGVEAIMAIRKQSPEARVIVVTTYDWDEDIYRAMQSGAQSYLLKDMSKTEIIGTIRAVHTGKPTLPPTVAERLEKRLEREELTQRELEVLELLTKGRSNREIGSALFISEDTVKSHLKTLFAKLHVQDRTQAAISAVKHGIIHLE